MKVIFSDEAINDLKRLYPEENRFYQVKLFIRSRLKDNTAERRAKEVDAFPDKDMYDYPVDGNVVLYQLLENPRKILVWAVHEAVEDIEEPPMD